MQAIEVNPNAADRGWWERFHAWRRQRLAETRPEDAATGDAEVEAWWAMEDRFRHRRLFCLDDGSRIWGTALLWAHKEDSPNYAANKQFMDAEVYVVREGRGRGWGRALLAPVVGVMEEYGCTVLTMESEEAAGWRFLEGLGAKAKLTEVESWLRVEGVDWDKVTRWAEEGRARNPQTRTLLYLGLVADEVEEEFCRTMTEVGNLVPREGLEAGDEVVTVERERAWAARIAAEGGDRLVYVSLEPDGSISGVTLMVVWKHDSKRADQYLTGVRLPWRGRGLGKWLKAAMLLELRQRYPAVERVVTGNAASNDAMRGINRELGFVPKRENVEYQIDRPTLQEALGR